MFVLASIETNLTRYSMRMEAGVSFHTWKNVNRQHTGMHTRLCGGDAYRCVDEPGSPGWAGGRPTTLLAVC